MKKTILLLVLALNFLIIFSAGADENQGFRFQKTDLQVVGPGGETLVYYRDGNDIVVRNCGSDYPVGADGNAVFKNRSDCKTVGQENRVPVESFKRELKAQFSITDADKVKPATKDDVDAARQQKDPNELAQLKAREKELSDKLTRIQAFIDSPSVGVDAKSAKDKADTKNQLDQVRSELASANHRDSAIKKINKEINDIVDLKIGSTKMEPVTSNKNGDQAIYTLLKQFDASRVECGTDEILDGAIPQPQDSQPHPGGRTTDLKKSSDRSIASVADSSDGKTKKRMANCAPLAGSIKKTKSGTPWYLVSRKRDPSTGKIYEVWQDSHTKALWGDRLDSNSSQYGAEAKCNSEEGKRAATGISERVFELPKKEDFQTAKDDGITEVLPNKDHWFWSSSVVSGYDDVAWEFNGHFGNVVGDYRNNGESVRCVSR